MGCLLTNCSRRSHFFTLSTCRSLTGARLFKPAALTLQHKHDFGFHGYAESKPHKDHHFNRSKAPVFSLYHYHNCTHASKMCSKSRVSEQQRILQKALKSQVKGDRVIQGEGLFFLKDQVLVLKCLKVFQDLQQESQDDLHLSTLDPTYLLWDLKARTDSVRSA